MRLDRLLQTQSDERLALLARGGHDFAFEEIVRRYREPLARYLRRLLRDPLAVEDALERGLIRAWASLLDGDAPIELRPWLYGTVHAAAVRGRRPEAARSLGFRDRPLVEAARHARAAARGALTALVPPRALVQLAAASA